MEASQLPGARGGQEAMRAISLIAIAAMLLTGCASRPLTPEQRAQLMRAYQAQQAVNAQNAAAMRAAAQANQQTHCISNVAGSSVYTNCN
jgi:PBP1b-binding outer membrane lipoprotein LpoB